MEVLTVQLDLIPAMPEDLKSLQRIDNDVPKYTIKHGQLFFIKSMITNLLEGPYILSEDTCKESLAEYLSCKMLFIPINNFESQIPIIKKTAHAN